MSRGMQAMASGKQLAVAGLGVLVEVAVAQVPGAVETRAASSHGRGI